MAPGGISPLQATTGTLVKIRKIESQPPNIPDSKTEGIQKYEWPGLEDPTHTTDTKIGGIHTRNKIQITPIQIFI